MLPMRVFGRYGKTITQCELVWWNNQPRLNCYLDVSTNPLVDQKGKIVPRHCFKSEKRSISLMGFPDPMFVAVKNKLEHVHPFILNNVLGREGSTDQRQYLDNLVNFIDRNLGLNLRQVNQQNVSVWNSILKTALENKILMSDWAWWQSRHGFFAGPGGDNMVIV